MLVLFNARLLDGTGAPARANVSVMIKNDKIYALGEAMRTPVGVQAIDLGGRTLMPGLCDSHVHFGGNEDPTRQGVTGARDNYWYAESRERLLRHGVTSVRSGGDFAEDLLKIRDRTEAGDFRGPRVMACGPSFQAQGGHPAWTVFLGNPDIIQNLPFCTEDPEDARAEVRRQKDAGFDHVKAFLCDRNFTNGEPSPKLSPEVLRAVADEAKKCGLPLMVHATSQQDALDAAAAGATTVEHLNWAAETGGELPESFISAFASAGTYCVPTLATGLYFPLAEKYPPDSARDISALIKTALSPDGPEYIPALSAVLNAAAALYRAGIPLVCGTDAGAAFVPMGESLHTEMKLMAAAGIPCLEVISAATSRGAEVEGKSDIFGTIEPGKAADLLVISGKPDEVIGDIDKIALVIKGGKILVDNMLG